jgi:hypothetical protein
VEGDVLDLAHAAVIVHHPVRLDHHRPVVPAVGDHQVPARSPDGVVEVPRVGGLERERLLAHHVRARLERRLRLLPVIAGRTADHDDVRLRLDHVAPVARRRLEAELVLDPLQQVGVPAVDDRELDLIPVCSEVREMRADGP